EERKAGGSKAERGMRKEGRRERVVQRLGAGKVTPLSIQSPVYGLNQWFARLILPLQLLPQLPPLPLSVSCKSMPRGDGGKAVVKGSDKKGDKPKKKSKKKSSKDSAGGRVHVDILGETAMKNALYICHSVQELLFWRGYQWAPGGKKQKKGKKGKK
ncbi:uncharacterized protein LOC121874338, partial [Homarus americanus]|uniref:uncharacterized protein LOC121874338 n=1 Tax=Homarus americanus TaxID=6706 RepID=UPI001C4622CD